MKSHENGEGLFKASLNLVSDVSTSIQFTGGEVTLKADELVEAVGQAKSRGFTDIRVQTNGRMLAYGNLVERLQDAGVHAVDISLHGAQSRSHDWITRVPESFRQTVAGIRKAVQVGLDVAVHMVVIKSNFREAPDLAKLCAKLGVSDLHFRMVVSEGWAAEEAAIPSLTPRYALVLPYIARAVLRAERSGMDVHLHDFPLCQSGKLSAHLNTTETQWSGLPEGAWLRAERVFPAPCQECGVRSSCVGVTVAYNDYYGSMDLVPFDADLTAKKKRA